MAGMNIENLFADALRKRESELGYAPERREPPPKEKFGGLSPEEYLQQMLVDKGVLDADGYTEDRADKQSVDEFMDLFNPGTEGNPLGTNTPPQEFADSGAAGNWWEDAVIAGSGGQPTNPPPGGDGGGGGGGGGGGPGPGPGPGDPFTPPPIQGPPVNWQNYSDAPSGNEDFYAAQASQLKGQNDQLMADQYAAQQYEAPEAGPAEDPWAWANGGEGLGPPAQAYFGGEGGEPGYTWGFAPGVEAGMTNRELFGVVGGNIDEVYRDMLAEGFGDVSSENPTDAGNMVQFASGSNMDPNYYRSRHDADVSDNYRGALDALIGATYKRSDLQTPPGGGPTAAQGYALTVPQYAEAAAAATAGE